MQDINKSKDQLIAELETTRWEMAEMRQRLTELESLAVTHEQMKEALKESDARLASIVNIANEAVISIDETQHIIFFNQGAARIFGYSPYEAIGESLDILLPKRLVQVHQEQVDQFANSDVIARLMKVPSRVKDL